MPRSLALVLLAGCAPGASPIAPSGPRPPPSEGGATAAPTPAAPAEELEIAFLAVGGYLLRRGGDAVLTPPLYTNPDLLETTLGTIHSDPALVARFGAGVPLEDVDAILVGHAHYDHLLDAPTLWPRTAEATFYGNRSMARILAAFAPDRAPECAEAPAPEVVIPRDRVVALEDLGVIDGRLCADGADEGAWVEVEGTGIRFRALCSMHPDQIGPIHFAPGEVEADLCAPPERAEDWREGTTLAFLVDFLDDDGRPVFRVYYQDAPTEVPVGLFAPELLDEKGVDVALLNVGSHTSVDDHPGATLRLLSPRYTIGGHWEDFFRTLDEPVIPLLGHDLEAYAAAAEAALGDDEELPVVVDGVAEDARQWVPMPGTVFRFPSEP